MLHGQPTRGKVKSVAPHQRKFGVGILGAGTVGGGLIRLIQDGLAYRPAGLEIRKIGVRRGWQKPAVLLSRIIYSPATSTRSLTTGRSTSSLRPWAAWNPRGRSWNGRCAPANTS